jgi:Na+-driven multidrug efflux pump
MLSGRIGASGIWWAIPAGWLIGLMLSFFYYRTGRWKTKTVVKYYDNL